MEKGKSVRPEDREECSEMPSSRHDLEAAHSAHSSSGGHTPSRQSKVPAWIEACPTLRDGGQLTAAGEGESLFSVCSHW